VKVLAQSFIAQALKDRTRGRQKAAKKRRKNFESGF
jgi:hypothetical protein